MKNVPNLAAPTNCVFVTPLYTLLGYRQLKGAFVFNISALMIELIFQFSDKKYVPVIDVSNTSGSAYMYLHLNYKASAGSIYRYIVYKNSVVPISSILKSFL